MKLLRRFSVCLVLISSSLLLWLPPANAYEPEMHQQLTFLAAKQFNRCMEQLDAPARLSALDTRYIARANAAQADTNVFVRMFRWPYYNRADQQKRTAMWLFDTRFHEHLDELVSELPSRDGRRQLRDLGRIVNYVQDVTSPAHTVPVFTGRWWRFSISDRFDRYPVMERQIEQSTGDVCEPLRQMPEAINQVIAQTASRTIESVKGPVEGMPTTWESFWKLAQDAANFGEYGNAGNSFGQRVEFRCGSDERCLLLKNDPLYDDFAAMQQRSAVRATVQAMYLYRWLFRDKPIPGVSP